MDHAVEPYRLDYANSRPKQQEIVQTLQDMGFRPYVNGRNVNVSSKQLYDAVQVFGNGAAQKHIPRWYLMLPAHRLKDLFATLMAGDGDAHGSRYSTASCHLADAVMEIALKLGQRAWINRDGDMYRVHLSDRTTISTRRAQRTIEHYRGRVYDVTVKNHVLLVRRNGKPMWSGNCGTYDGGREKAPAAICRKVATAVLAGTHDIEIWGSGEQTRSFTYIDDCVQRHPGDHDQRRDHIPDQSRQQREGLDQPARRHRRGDRRGAAQAALQPRLRPRA